MGSLQAGAVSLRDECREGVLAALDQAARVLARGGVVAYPTESCYGLGCDPRNHAALRRLLRLKRRSPAMGVIIIGAHIGQLVPYLDLSDPAVLAPALETWPGPHTWLLPAKPGVSPWLRGAHPRIAVRITAHRGAARLCKLFGGAIVSTSANRHGRSPATRAREVQRMFGSSIDYIVRGRVGGLAPTEIRDGVTGAVVRATASPREAAD